MGNSGISPKPASESCFVADEGTGFDVPHAIVVSGDVVSVFLEASARRRLEGRRDDPRRPS